MGNLHKAIPLSDMDNDSGDLDCLLPMYCFNSKLWKSDRRRFYVSKYNRELRDYFSRLLKPGDAN